jgi:beta-glucanase (GH16 family)
MRPANVRGSISSFFLYAGVAATNSHFEIDIEFIGGTSLLHTNYWIHGRNFPLDFDLAKRGIDPYAGSRRYRFIWAEEEIAWQVQTDAGDWLELRRESARIDTPMQLMMNAWHGDNVGYSKDFPGPYDGSDGVAQYRFLSIER